jgi:hypothetical protein
VPVEAAGAFYSTTRQACKRRALKCPAMRVPIQAGGPGTAVLSSSPDSYGVIAVVGDGCSSPAADVGAVERVRLLPRTRPVPEGRAITAGAY